MSKQLKGLVIAAAAVVVLGAALFLVMNYFNENELPSSGIDRPDTSVLLHQSSIYDIESFTVANENGEVFFQNDGSGVFTCPALEGLPVLTETISTLSGSCAYLKATETVAENVTDLALYGLDDPRAVLTIKTKDGSYTLEVGNDAPGGYDTYVKEPGSATVYLLSSGLTAPMMLDELEFVDPVVTSYDEATEFVLRSLYLGGTARPVPVEGGMVETTMFGTAADGSPNMLFKLTKPTERHFNSTTGEEVFASLFGITAEEITAVNPTAEDLAAYGLDEPYTDLRIGYGENLEMSLRISTPVDNKAYLMRDEIPVIYKVSTEGMLWVETQYEDLVMSLLLLAYINDVSAVDVITPDKDYTFEINGHDRTMTAWYEGQMLDLDNFKSLYQNLIGIPADEYTTTQPEEDAAELLRIVFHYDDGRPDNTLTFYEGPPRQCYMALDGYIEFLARSTYVEKVINDCELLLAGEEVFTIY